MMIPIRSGHVPEEQREGGHEHEQEKHLADLDAEIEGEQRGDEMVAGELQLVAQDEGEAEAVHDAEGEGDHPAALDGGADDVLERHVDDGGGDQRLDERRKPERVRHEAEGGGDQRDRMRHREGGDEQR